MKPHTFLLFMLLGSISVQTKAQWVPLNGPSPGAIVSCFYPLSDSILVGASGIYKTTNNGATWQRINYHEAFTFINSKGRILVAANPCLYSDDSGTTWNEVGNMSGTGDQVRISDIVNFESILLAISDGASYLLISSDNGSTWAFPPKSPPGSNHYTSLASNSQGIWVSTDNGNGVFVMSDGNNWQSVNLGLDNDTVKKLYSCPIGLFAGTTNGVFMLSTKDFTWTKASTGLPASSEVLSFTSNDSTLFASVSNNNRIVQVFMSSSAGKTWKDVTDGTDFPSQIISMAAIGDYLFVGTQGNGVWRRSLAEMIPSSVTDKPLTNQEVLTNPNPFSQNTRITCTLPGGYSVVSIMNLLGVEVVRLFEGQLDAGEHSFTWNVNGIAPGMYEGVVRSGELVEHVSMIVLK